MNERVRLVGKPSKISEEGNAWILHFPRFAEEGTHYHTYGELTPYFKGLTEGRLLGTKCSNAKCPIYKGKGELWIPPRRDCPDCHQPMVWEEVKNPRGTIYTYTYVERGGTGLEIECPYYQIDVKVDGVCSIIKSYLINRKPIKIGDKVKAGFLTGKEATHTCLDLYWELC
ncbi:MAG: hypothetical protein HY537_03015 [Deltaproteobacteria bacterium]|nr:hypothetical protein [Deltaproteobacteria bacterium]